MSLYAKRYTTKKDLVIIHGLFGSGENWAQIGKSLAERFNVYCVDLRNHGKSFRDSEMTYGLMAQDILQFLKSQHIEKSSFIAHSMGGKVLMSFLEDYSTLCDQAVIVDVAPKKYPPHHNVIFNALSSLALDDIKTRAEADSALKISIPNTSTRQFLIKSLAHNEFGKFEWQFNLESLIKNYHYLMSYSVNIEPVETDMLFIRGELSDYIEDSDYPKLYAKYPKAKIETILGASHWVHAEKMPDFLKLVNNFLK